MKFWSAVFAAVFGTLVVRNRFLFATPIHELGDSGANSIIVNQAKHFSLLVGNYSRMGFSHPGPGFIYVQAAGEWFFHDLLGVVPTPWNGQLLAVYALNAAMLATVAAIVGRRVGSWRAAAVALFALVLTVAYYPPVITSTWMPLVYVPTFLLLLFASASVTAGFTRDLWAVALAGGLLIHGHVVFLFFASAVGGIALAAALLRHHGLRLQPRWPLLRRAEAFPVPAGTWLLAGGIFLAFLVPIGLHTFTDWPGEFGKYFGYGTSPQAGSHAVLPSLSYVYQYWWPREMHTGWLGLLGIPLILAVVYAAWRTRDRFVRAGLWLCLLVSVLLAAYAYTGVDRVTDPYMGYFYWAVPLFLISCVAVWSVPRLVQRIPAAVPVAAAVLVIALVPGFHTVTHDDRPEVPAALESLNRHAQGRPIVVELVTEGDIGLDLPGLAHWARRNGMRVCLRDDRWSFLTTKEYICTPTEVATGMRVLRWRVEETDVPHTGELTRVGHSAFTTIPAGWT